ncbi:MAG: sensor histidine kinase [Clostridiales bacterium]|nr:sensor histidine kinase [Clostridiales bacterium]
MKNWIIIRSGIIILIGTAFIALENVVGLRFGLLLTLFVMYILMPIVRLKIHNEKMQIATLIIDIGLIFWMSLSSRYVINYYIYILYMSLLLEVGLVYTLKWSRYMMGLIILVSLYHYWTLFIYRDNMGTVSEIVFMCVINGLIVFSVALNNINRIEKEKQIKLNSVLQETNEQLEVLTRMAVKNNIARDIHDTFGHDMMGLIMEIEMAQVLVDQDSEKAKLMLTKAKQSARNGMKTIRKVVETLRNDELEIIEDSIEEMIVNFKSRMNISVQYMLFEHINALPKKYLEVLYRLIQECLTNSIRHGEASKIEIEVKEGLHTIVFSIKDNGKGASDIIEGYGLKGMRERVEALNGSLRIKSDSGFVVEGYIEVGND